MNLGQPPERLARLALGALITAFVLRLAWVVAIPTIPVSDSYAYAVFAQNLAQGFGYGWEPNRPSAYWPVGTSAVYAAFFRIFGYDYLPIALFQLLVGVAIVALAMALARRWLGNAAAVGTGWILACWPLLIQYTTILASELYFVFFVLLAFWLASMRGSKWSSRGLLAGVALAGASYVRPLALIMAPFLFANEALEKPQRLRAIAACLVAILAMAACIAPWSVRNWRVFDHFVAVSTNAGANLWMGNNPSGSIEYMELPKLGIHNEAERDKFLGKQAWEYIKQNPAEFVARSFKKAARLHDRESIGVVWNEEGIVQRAGQVWVMPLKLISSAYWWAILIAAAFGISALGRDRGVFHLLTSSPVLTWAYFALVHSVTVAGDRYHVPSVPFIAMIAAYALKPLWSPKGGHNEG